MDTQEQLPKDPSSVLLPHHPSIQEQIEQKLASATAIKTATAPAQHPFPPPKASSSRNHMGALKWIMLLLVIIIVISIGLVIALYANFASGKNKLKATATPKPTIATTSIIDTANWLTYTNTQYGFSFQYPPNLKLTEIMQPSRTDQKISTLSLGLNGKTSSFSFSLEPNTKKLTLQDWHSAQTNEENINCKIDCAGFSSPTKLISVGRNQAIQQNLSSVVGTTNIYLSINDTTVLWASGTSSKESGTLEVEPTDATKTLLSQILSTVNFTNQTSPSSSSSAFPTTP